MTGARSLEEMHPVQEVMVRPAGAGCESRLVLLAAVMTVCACALFIWLQQGDVREETVPEWRVSAFDDLGAAELAVFNALTSAGPEIEAMHGELAGEWPGVTRLEREFVPPFVRDAAWTRSGRLNWTRSVLATGESHIAVYLGTPQDADFSGAFLLVMLHSHVKKQGNASVRPTHPPFEVWMHREQAPALPESVTDQALISAGWREVVARSGEEETRHARGRKFQQ